jgi:tetratricopeptide (TPR) repeat protein
MPSNDQWKMRSMFHARLALVLIACVQLDARADGVGDAQQFDAVSRAVASQPEDIAAGNDLRKLCRERKMQEKCIEFFDALTKKHPLAAAARYNAALAHIDHLPGHSLLAQARMSTNSIEHASAVLEHAPSDWLALYIRGLNNLYWPTWYRRTDRAITDLSRCTEMSESLPSERRASYMALAHVALGDAYVKAGKIEQALEVWRRGMAAHPSPELTKRLAVSPDALPQTIEQVRSREVPVDTDIGFYVGAGQG